MFTITNDTKFWIVFVDNQFSYYASQPGAERVYNMIGDIESSPFGSCGIVPPGYVPINRFTGESMETGRFSEMRPIDIEAYIQRRYWKQRYHSHGEDPLEHRQKRINPGQFQKYFERNFKGMPWKPSMF